MAIYCVLSIPLGIVWFSAREPLQRTVRRPVVPLDFDAAGPYRGSHRAMSTAAGGVGWCRTLMGVLANSWPKRRSKRHRGSQSPDMPHTGCTGAHCTCVVGAHRKEYCENKGTPRQHPRMNNLDGGALPPGTYVSEHDRPFGGHKENN